MDVITIIFWGGIIIGALSIIGTAINKLKGVIRYGERRFP